MFHVCSGHLNQLIRRLWPQRNTGKKEESGPAAECLELAIDICLGFPKLHEGTRASFTELGPFVPAPREETI